MVLETLFTPFVKECPICVMARGTLERLLDAPCLDTLFCPYRPTIVHAAYQANKAAIQDLVVREYPA
jgi:hypothetical protein